MSSSGPIRAWANISCYDAVRTAALPDELLLDFLEQTYVAAADAAGWDRAALECPLGTPGRVRETNRPAYSVGGYRRTLPASVGLTYSLP